MRVPRRIVPRRGALPRQLTRGRVVGPLIIALLVLATSPFGGLRAAPTPPPDTLQLGHEVDLGSFTVRVVKVLAAPSLETAGSYTLKPPDPGGRLLIIEMHATNTTDAPLSTSAIAKSFGGPRAAVVPWPGERAIRGDVVAVADARRVSYVNPGLTLHAVVVFPQPATWKGTSIDLGLTAYRFREKDPYSLEPQSWVLDTEVARGSVPTQVRS